MSLKTVPTFVLWISQLPWGLEIPSLTFFDSPFRVDFKNIHFYVIWLNLDRDIAKILGDLVSGRLFPREPVNRKSHKIFQKF